MVAQAQRVTDHDRELIETVREQTKRAGREIEKSEERELAREVRGRLRDRKCKERAESKDGESYGEREGERVKTRESKEVFLIGKTRRKREGN